MIKTSSDLLKHALSCSLLIVLSISAIGIVSGMLLHYYFASPNIVCLRIIQGFATIILLWATLTLVGFEIQTYSGNTLTERMNQLIFRFLYCLGTYLVIVSLAWF